MSSRSKKGVGFKSKGSRTSKKAALKKFIDEEAVESDGDAISDESDAADNSGVDGVRFGSTPPPAVELLKMVSIQSKGKHRLGRSRVNRRVSEDESTSEEDPSILVNNDKMYAAPSNIDPNALPPPVSTRAGRAKRQYDKKDGVQYSPAAKRQKGLTSDSIPDPVLTVATAREIFGGMLTSMFPHLSARPLGDHLGVVAVTSADVVPVLSDEQSETPEVDDPIGSQQAAILQLIADANEGVEGVVGKGLIGAVGVGASDASSITLSSGDDAGVLPADVVSVVVARTLESDTFAVSDTGAVAAAELVARVAAPYDRAAKQALQIADYMYSSADTGPSAGSQLNLETKAAAVNRSGDVNFGRSAGVAKSTKTGIVYQSDLEITKIKYDPTAKCRVSDPFLQDKVLAPTYVGLFPLPGGRLLLPAFQKKEDEFNYDLSGGRVIFSLWKKIIPLLDFGVVAPAILFVDAKGGFINPSRIDPARISIQFTTHDSSRYILLADGIVATCVSSVMSSESLLVYGRSIGKALPRKWLTGLMHNQEYERFVALICMVFGAAVVYGQLSNGGVLFQSRLGSPKGSGTAKDITASGLVSVQKGFTPSAVVTKHSLGFEDTIPVYDGRKAHINFQMDLPKLLSNEYLPFFEGEIPFGSYVVVGYTVTGWNAVPSVNADKIKHPHLGCNIMWAIVLGVRDIDDGM
ncbi:hypothetical protein C8J57DRAFT_1738103 [Mycena rebaudengoi]|nr:hypothetical protein C8J57DRAFT_1738103 [Mycena rebaudengoi]